MARKGLRNAALLGGAALLAAKMMSGKDKDSKESKAETAKDDMDTTGGGDTGIATQRLADFRGKSGNADMDIGPRMPGRRAAAQGIADMEDREAGERFAQMEGRTASGLPREARGIGSVFDRSAPVAGRPRGGMKKGGVVSSASKRADGIAVKGKTKGRMV
jgi:hypothetical protein